MLPPPPGAPALKSLGAISTALTKALVSVLSGRGGLCTLMRLSVRACALCMKIRGWCIGGSDVTACFSMWKRMCKYGQTDVFRDLANKQTIRQSISFFYFYFYFYFFNGFCFAFPPPLFLVLCLTIRMARVTSLRARLHPFPRHLKGSSHGVYCMITMGRMVRWGHGWPHPNASDA